MGLEKELEIPTPSSSVPFLLINWIEVQLLAAQEWVWRLSGQHSPLLHAECLQRPHSVLLLVRLLTRTSPALQVRGSPSLH